MTRFPFSDDQAIRRLAMARPSHAVDVAISERDLSAVLDTITAQPRGRLDPVQRRRLGRGSLLVAAGGATAVALLLVVPGAALPSAADVLSHARSAIADTSKDILEMHQTLPDGGTSTAWLDIATGASYSDSFAAEPGGIFETRSWVLANGQQVNVDLHNKWWWETPVGSVRIIAGNMPADIAANLNNGTYDVVARPVVGGTPTLELSESIQPGETETMWVDASTYLPFKSEFSTTGGSTDTETYTWEQADSTTEAVFTVAVPPGLTQVTGHGEPGSAEWYGTGGSSGTASSSPAANSGNAGVSNSSGTGSAGAVAP